MMNLNQIKPAAEIARHPSKAHKRRIDMFVRLKRHCELRLVGGCGIEFFRVPRQLTCLA